MLESSELPRILLASNVQVKAVEGQKGGKVNLKAHVLLSNEGRELRIVIVKKNLDKETAKVKLVVRGKYGNGSLMMLEGPSFTSLVDEITLAGQRVGEMGLSGCSH
jgi:hypothetical protein